MYPPTSLSLPYVWNEAGTHLNYNAICVAYLEPESRGWRITLTFAGRVYVGRAASLRQGRYFVERWIGCRMGFPGPMRRRPAPDRDRERLRTMLQRIGGDWRIVT